MKKQANIPATAQANIAQIRTRYDWDELCNGEAWGLTIGEDLESPANPTKAINFIQWAREQFKQRDCKLQYSLAKPYQQGDVLWIQAIPEKELQKMSTLSKRSSRSKRSSKKSK